MLNIPGKYYHALFYLSYKTWKCCLCSLLPTVSLSLCCNITQAVFCYLVLTCFKTNTLTYCLQLFLHNSLASRSLYSTAGGFISKNCANVWFITLNCYCLPFRKHFRIFCTKVILCLQHKKWVGEWKTGFLLTDIIYITQIA